MGISTIAGGTDIAMTIAEANSTAVARRRRLGDGRTATAEVRSGVSTTGAEIGVAVETRTEVAEAEMAVRRRLVTVAEPAEAEGVGAGADRPSSGTSLAGPSSPRPPTAAQGVTRAEIAEIVDGTGHQGGRPATKGTGVMAAIAVDVGTTTAVAVVGATIGLIGDGGRPPPWHGATTAMQEVAIKGKKRPGWI